MGIIVHDGSEGAEYNSYASRSEADLYHGDRATPGWSTAEDANRDAALIRATDYIDAHYRFTELDLPTRARATIALAALALNDTLAGRAERDVVETEQKLEGVGSKRLKYADRAPADPYPVVTKILAPITVQASGGVTVGRLIR